MSPKIQLTIPSILTSIFGLILFTLGGSISISAIFISIFGHKESIDSSTVLISVLLLALGLVLSKIWSPAYRVFMNKAEWYVPIAAILAVVIFVAVFVVAFRNHVYLADLQSFGSVGDFFGGTLGTIFSFLALFLVVKQNGDIEKRELNRAQKDDDRDKIIRLDFLGQQLYRDLEFIDSKLRSLKFRDKEGERALLTFISAKRLDRNIDITERTSSKLSSSASILNHIFREIFIGLAKEDITNEEFGLYSKHYDFLRHIFSETFLKTFVEMMTFYESTMQGELFLKHLCQQVEENEGKYPDPREIVKIQAILDFSL